MPRLIAFLAASLFLASQLAHAEAPPPRVKARQGDSPTRVLFVGNSYFYYNDSLHNHVQRMVIAGDAALQGKLQYKSATIGGAELSHHNIDHLTTPGRIGVKEPFQLVILQGGSAEPLSDARRKRFHDTVLEFDKVIRQRGGRTALYMPHAYVKPHKQAKPENIRLTEEAYLKAANEIDALVIPVGLAFEEAYRRKPGIQLHKDFDGSHPDLIGSYLAACTVYAAVYGKSPVGNAYDYYGKIDKGTAAFLQQVAADTVKKFYGR
ncbi:MAG TPA: DUF4886 domain-containing protein [Usitatibacter sp.]|nr:DUF4886 domain-containing protein [Usitatibacter sp.]